MKVLITYGGTTERIDSVRTMSNISSGALGREIASQMQKIADVTVIDSGSTAEVYAKMKELVPQVDVVIHAMAVSDFTFKKNEVKVKSSSTEAFIEYMKNNIVKTPKILDKIKVWNPECLLVSFKLEVGVSHENLLISARNSMKGEFVLANDLVEIKKKKLHVGYLLSKHTAQQFNGKTEIAKGIVNECINWNNRKHISL
ncbi:MAG: hypothetical protein B6I31_00865 [Desulfobacteraceae bacterium 4572_19]|nr:MAG: hypothetical protein B6I31_00865 [Desulfobacteraceae bacterium 4572_19]